MHDTNSALFACYILFIYFRGRSIARIEREMRALGHPNFHRRILYPRGPKPGWILKFGWQSAVGGQQSAKGELETDGPAGSPPYEGGVAAFRRRGGSLSGLETNRPQSAESTPPSLPTANSQPPTDFKNWLRTVSPNMTWSWRHQQVIIEQLERVTRGECKRLMIFLPPRHGKSELVTVRYTAWRMQRDPSMNVILGSYNQRLADRFSRKIRKVIADAESLESSAKSTPPFKGGVPEGFAEGGVVNGRHASESARAVSSNNIGSTLHSQQGRVSGANPNPQCSAEPPASAGGTAPKRHTTRLTASVLSSTRPPPAHAGGSAFPFVSTKPANSVSEWETTAGGGFRSVGVGSGVTGFGASLIVIDDPIKSRAEAESETYRERVWDWFTDDLYTRLEPDGAIVLIQTRWHEDDLAGRLLREASDEGAEHWDVINLPALSEPPADAPGLLEATPESSGGNTTVRECVGRALGAETPGSPPSKGGVADASSDGVADASSDGVVNGRPASAPPMTKSLDWRETPNEPLCPERFNTEALRRIRTRLGEYSFSALYQQRPTPADGGVFKREWFKIAVSAPPGLKWKRGYDLAVSTKTNADYTASFRCAFDKEGNLYISGGLRARLEYPDQRRFIIDRIKDEPDTEHGVELALHGQALIQDLRREPGVRGHLLRGVKPESDKLTRALTWAPLAEEGKVILIRNTGVSTPHVSKGSASHSTRLPGLSDPVAENPQSALRIPHSNWIPDFLDEVCAFPNAVHDDQVDAVSLAVQMLKRPGRRAWGF